ncbi:type ISP restriction/modification enzyme [Microbacterium oxydans]|uniref:type ISP restriction/modification enzyme n=1 Tax=Microbacterium oxydans TaxID=82380 RepID=UPI00111DD818|nr:type ISP restriction/modification enzyme [Microbacterium oxydans]
MNTSLRAALNTYCKELSSQYATGHAKEHAYRPALKTLMEAFENIIAINDPKKSEHGNPDFVFLQKDNPAIVRGYAEAKDVDIKLDSVEGSEQMERYRGYANLFLTNYLDFRFYRNGEKYKTIVIGSRTSTGLAFDAEATEALIREVSEFVALPPEKIASGRRLATLMGAKARRLRDDVDDFVKNGDDELSKIMQMIKDRLVPDIDAPKFADMYAQTLVYGLFVARYADSTPATFSRQEARDLVPKSNPFLRAFFDHIAGAEFDDRLGYIVDELCAVFRVSDVEDIVTKHLKVSEVTRSEKDPIIHFYEDFLATYDPRMKRAMGAYYTPVPVVRYIVRRVDEVLKQHFGICDGLADTEKLSYTPKTSTHPLTAEAEAARVESAAEVDLHRVQLLDPAVGTGTFLNETIKYIHTQFADQQGRWPKYVDEDLLPRVHGFELMMAPYTVAHLKLGMTLTETGAPKSAARVNVFLTNTLQEGLAAEPGLLEFGLSEAVTEESQLAADVKTNQPIMVILGNPPYSASSNNRTKFANKLVDKYKVEPGGLGKLDEEKTWLNDDYVKFLSFAEGMIAANGTGVVAMITNNGYLDNPTFRGMRWHLLRTFDDIYVLDLHGNANKGEVAPDGSKDENVFPIRQGVGIIIAVKTTGSADLATVHHSELWGKRADKFAALIDHEIEWQVLDLDPEFLFFVPRGTNGKEEYDSGIPVDKLFRVGSTGIVTRGDSFIVDTHKSVIEDRVKKLTRGGYDAAAMTEEFGLGEAYAPWVLANRGALSFDSSKLIPIAYRPFDHRYTYFSNKVLWRWREEVMKHFLQEKRPNVGLVTTRLQKTNPGAFVSNMPIGHKVFNSYDSNSLFPLYVFASDGTMESNLDPTQVAALTAGLSTPPSPQEIFDYVYGVLYTPKFREAYAELMVSGFPKIPKPTTDGSFRKIAELGAQLRELHLLSEKLPTTTTFPIVGDDVVRTVTYKDGAVWINTTQFFGNVSEAAWSQFIGGYRPAYQWLQDRRRKSLSNTDFTQYQQIVATLEATALAMNELDAASPDYIGAVE